MNKSKYIWSDRYGKDAREGLQVWLSKNVVGYKRNNLNKYLLAFSKNFDERDIKNLVNFTSKNFNEFTTFIINNYKHEN